MSKFILFTDSTTTINLRDFYNKPDEKFGIRIEGGSRAIFLFITRKNKTVKVLNSEYKKKLNMLCKREKEGVHSPERDKLKELTVDLTTEDGRSEALLLFAAFAGLMTKKTKDYAYAHGSQVLLGCFKDKTGSVWIVGAYYNRAAEEWLFSAFDAAEYWMKKEHTQKPSYTVPRL